MKWSQNAVTVGLIAGALALALLPWLGQGFPHWPAWTFVGTWEAWRWWLLGRNPRDLRGSWIVWAAGVIALIHALALEALESALLTFAS